MKLPLVIAVVVAFGWAPGAALTQSSPPAMPTFLVLVGAGLAGTGVLARHMITQYGMSGHP